ncbi:MAG: Gfo/Idh/MocA family oxidoreductase [Armatimonadetes bacterium]|nr:Gfo/Idh/MocA family oxidoreductase [Armatimonadota bacterium]
MEKVRAGVVGMGRGCGLAKWMAQRIPQYEVVAVCDRSPERLKSRAAEIEVPDLKLYTDHRKMLAEEQLDAVMVETDPCAIAEVACDALYSGRHVICDVPLSYRLHDCWDIVIAVERTGLKFQMGEQLRYARFIHEWQQMNMEGRLGKILYAEGQYIHDIGNGRMFWDPVQGRYYGVADADGVPGLVQSDRRPMHALTYNPHELSPILKVLQDRVRTVSCMATRRGGYTYQVPDRSDLEVALMRTEGDTIIRIVNAFGCPDPGVRQHWYSFMGTKGQVELKRARWDRPKVWFKDENMADYVAVEDLGWSPAEVKEEAAGTGHGGLDFYPMYRFARAILEDTPTDMDVYLAAEACAPGIVAGISAEYEGLPFAVPDFRPGPHRKAGEPPATYMARSLYGDIEREGATHHPRGNA